MLPWIFAVTGVISTWTMLGLLLFGTGALIREIFQPKALGLNDVFRCFWLGWAAVLVYLQLWHFWFPIDWRVSAAVGVVGGIGLIRSRSAWIALLRSGLKTTSVLFVIFLVLVVLWFADRALGPVHLYDSGNYHLPVIRWSVTYPVVKGLGNIDGHLAFNSAYLLYQAMLEVGFWYGRSSHIGNGLPLITLTLFCLVSARRAFLSHNASDGTLLFPVIVLTPVVVLLRRISSASTDLSATVIILVMTWCLLEFAFNQNGGGSSAGTQAFQVFLGTVLCASAVCIKLSNVFYAVFACLVFLFIWLRRDVLPYTYRLRVAALCSFSVLTIGVLWVGRNILLSGYPLFPSIAMKAAVPWRIPEVFAEWYGWWIRSWARTQNLDQLPDEGLSWIGAWITRQLWRAKIEGIMPLLLTLAAVVYLFTQLRRRNMRPYLLSAFKGLTWAPSIVALPAWFLIAPNIRFAMGILWGMAAQALSFVFWILSVQNRSRAARLLLICVSTMPAVALLYEIRLATRHFQGSIAAAALALLWTSPGPDHGLHPVYRSAVERVVTSYGVIAYQPYERDCRERGIERERWRDCVMWNGPIPGAQKINENLAYLKPGTPGAGFLIYEPATPWAHRSSDAVLRYQREHKSNIRQLAYHFRVAPKTIREALARSFNAAMRR